MSTMMYSAAGSVANAVIVCQFDFRGLLVRALTSRKHSKSRQSAMLSLKPLQQGRQCQDIE